MIPIIKTTITTTNHQKEMAPKMKIRRFLNYYGSKFRAAKYYPEPLYEKIIEPFAGGAGYSCLHYNHDVELYDISDHVVSAWKFVINNREDIKYLSTEFNHLDELHECGGGKFLRRS